MKHTVLLIAALLLTACVDPRLNAGISIGNNGVTVSPSVSGQIAGGTVTYAPN